MAFRLAVDAINLAADRRGMGRYVRDILENWEHESDLELTLLVRDRSAVAPVRAEQPYSVRTIAQAQRERFDAVWYAWNGMRFDLPARRAVTIYDAFAFTQPHRNFVARQREQAPIARAARHANAITTISHWSAGEISRTLRVSQERIAVVPPARSSYWMPVDSQPSREPYVLFVAGPDARKNAPTLLHAFGRAFAQRELTLVVAGELRSEDARLLERSQIAYARVRPSDEELRELYSGAQAVAVPSYAEGYGLMAVEAMACGAPVLAADAAALPEACDGAAMLVPPRDIDAWCTALQRIATDANFREDLRAQSLARAARVDPTAPARGMLAILRG